MARLALLVASALSAASPPTRTGPVAVESGRGGFAWADAAIGAAAALGVVLVLAGVLFLKGDRNAS